MPETKEDGILINVEGSPISEHIICYHTSTSGDTITLYRVVERAYKRSDTNMALQSRIEIDNCGTEKRTSIRASPWILLEAANKNIRV